MATPAGCLRLRSTRHLRMSATNCHRILEPLRPRNCGPPPVDVALASSGTVQIPPPPPQFVPEPAADSGRPTGPAMALCRRRPACRGAGRGSRARRPPAVGILNCRGERAISGCGWQTGVNARRVHLRHLRDDQHLGRLPVRTESRCRWKSHVLRAPERLRRPSGYSLAMRR